MTLRQALASFDAPSFVKRHGGYKESRSSLSHEYLLTCPRCGSGRLRWHARKGTWICWGCRKTGDTIALVQLLERCEEHEAIAYVLDGYVGGDAPAQLDTEAICAPVKRQLTRLAQMPWPHGVDVLSQTPMHARAWSYLHSRGLTPAMVEHLRLGWGRQGWLDGYIVFPVYMDGGLVYWQGRQAQDPPTGPKTLNPRSQEGFATAQDVLFNYDAAKRDSHVVICEGPIDALKVGPNAVALFGKISSPVKVARLIRMRAMRYTVYLDRGEEERQHAERLAKQLDAYAPTYLATPPLGYDPGALTVEQNAHVIANAERFVPRLAALD